MRISFLFSNLLGEIKCHKTIKGIVVEKKDVLIIKDSNVRVRKWFQNTGVLQTFYMILGKSFRIEYPKITRLLGSLRWHEGEDTSLPEIELTF